MDMLYIEITDFCNLNCLHCYNRDNTSKAVLPMYKIDNLVSESASLGVKTIYFSGGEPLLHPDFLCILNIIERYPQINFVIATNGLLFTSQILIKLSLLHNVTIQFSLDSLNENTYALLRERAPLNVLIQNITDSVDLGIHVTTRTAISKINYLELENILNWTYKQGILPSFLFVEKQGNATCSWNELQLTLGEKLSITSKVIRFKNDKYLSIVPPKACAYCSLAEPSINHLDVKGNGDVYLCSMYKNSLVSNIFTHSLTEILKSPRIMEIQNRIRYRQNILQNNFCTECIAKEYCGQGCIGRALQNGAEFEVDSDCDFKKSLLICNRYGLIEKETIL